MRQPSARFTPKRLMLTTAVVWETLTRFVLGPLLVLGGLWFIAIPFAFATLLYGDRDAPPGWGEYLGDVFTRGVSPIGMGLVLMIGGIYLAATRGPRPTQGETNKSL